MGCTHHLLKCVNCVCYCQICGARVEMPKPENDAPPEPANEKPVEAPEPPTESLSGRKIGFDAHADADKKPAPRRRKKDKGE